MTGRQLHGAYERQLRRSLRPPLKPGRGGNRAMLNASRVFRTADIGGTGHGDRSRLWSDLHLGNQALLGENPAPAGTTAERMAWAEAEEQG